MEYPTTEAGFDRLLALHYVYPKPFNRLSPLLQHDPELAFLHRRSPLEIARLTGFTPNKAAELKSLYTEALRTSYLHIYSKHGILPVLMNQQYYPRGLLDLIDPPAVLYAKGNPELLCEAKKLAVIGSRKATGYSQEAMDLLIPPLVRNGYVVVSGLAKGADAMAHRTAIRDGGKTIAVLGSGFSHPYPKENLKLYNTIVETQLVLTEYPPYMAPKKWNFPMRNRIISGLAKGIAVTEAEIKSGTLSTIEHALEHGKDIFAVPGPITSQLSQGPNRLISEGARPVWTGEQIVQEYEGIGSLKS